MNELPLAGLLVGAKGVSPDPERTRALSEFPRPKYETGVHSFLGLVNQLFGFVPDLAHMNMALRSLTKEFEKVKRLLKSNMIVTHFYPNLPVIVLTDASCIFGPGYALEHMIDDRFCLVTCVSKSLTPKCSFYLKGCESFAVATDHRPFEGVFFKKGIFEVPNPCLQWICEKLAEFEGGSREVSSYCWLFTYAHDTHQLNNELESTQQPRPSTSASWHHHGNFHTA